VLLGAEELAGLMLSNRPVGDGLGLRGEPDGSTQVVLVADRFPAQGDPLADFARTVGGARVEAVARPDHVDLEVTRVLEVEYREDEGAAARTIAVARLATRHPIRCTLDVVRRRPGEPNLAALASAVLRLERDADARVHPLGGENSRAMTRRLAALAGRPRYLGES
jgi:hypothetical protein